MTAGPRHIKVPPGSELAAVLRQASNGPVVLETDGERYRLDRIDKEKEDIWEGYDPEQVRAAIEKYAGSWADLDTDAMIEDLRRARWEGSRPVDRS